MKHLLLGFALLSTSATAFARPAHSPRTKTTCAPAGYDWIKGAGDYLNTNLGPGKRPAIYATISLVSTEPANALIGKAPDRTQVWYAHGEVTRVNFPVITTLSGKFPMWINNGPSGAPFNGGNTTLALTISDNGSTTLHFQVDGRNRLGKGPQPISLSAVSSGSDANTQMFSAATNFFGSKLIVVALTKGEAVMTSPPPPPKMPIGTRFRITPSFRVTNSEDGVLDNTVEVQGSIYFNDWKDTVSDAVPHWHFSGKRGGGGTFTGPSFIVMERADDPQSQKLRVTGSVYDRDEGIFGDPMGASSDLMWFNKAQLPLKLTAASKTKPRPIQGDGSSESGTLEILVERLEDVY